MSIELLNSSSHSTSMNILLMNSGRLSASGNITQLQHRWKYAIDDQNWTSNLFSMTRFRHCTKKDVVRNNMFILPAKHCAHRMCPYISAYWYTSQMLYQQRKKNKNKKNNKSKNITSSTWIKYLFIWAVLETIWILCNEQSLPASFLFYRASYLCCIRGKY